MVSAWNCRSRLRLVLGKILSSAIRRLQISARTTANAFHDVFFGLSRVYAYASGDGEGATVNEAAQPAQNDFQARLAMFKKKETGPASGTA